ncbi:hypothetical protein [Rhizobium sp. SL42]|uniref:hypothetical protein n=1 Tax=Rhizobium sp. SL42 TaxID=2806346 RepID=UPI001F20EACC|nr:hypothetical protein [Rhizobium sp. SL42]UJW77014.1 hypothetical protein IM739_21220 [Rhizobium sp. SL42]
MSWLYFYCVSKYLMNFELLFNMHYVDKRAAPEALVLQGGGEALGAIARQT